MVIFLAGLQSIPSELYEAAEVDGAGPWQRFRSITLPLLRPTLLLAAVIASIGWLQFFEEPFVMTQGGPLNSTVSWAYHTYNQFSFGNYGQTAAISYLLFLAIALLAFGWFRLFRSKT
jgi:multiple sugar transport system permease protein